MKLIDKISKTNFVRELVRVASSITSSYGEMLLHDKSLDYDDLGTHDEKMIMQTFNYFYNLQAIVKDLEMVIAFLEIKDRSEIKNMYPKIEYQKDYFNYHVENFIFRIISITDIIGKIGNSVYQTGLEEKRCNGYTFKDKIKSSEIHLSSKLEALLDYTKSIRDKRHKLLHKGDKDYYYFYSVVVFEDFMPDGNSEETMERKKLTDEALKREIGIIKSEISNTVDMVADILAGMYDKLLELTKSM